MSMYSIQESRSIIRNVDAPLFKLTDMINKNNEAQEKIQYEFDITDKKKESIMNYFSQKRKKKNQL